MALREYGFWDYTCPGAGGMEHYRRDHYLELLDDMAAAGMNSLVMIVKWLTTGYRSRLPWLDQDPCNAAIASDNELIRTVLREARRRDIKVWLGAVATYFVPQAYGHSEHRRFEPWVDGEPREVRVYDLDMPHVAERAVEIFDEIVALFPQADGLLVELEFGDTFGPHRVRPYNRWARAHDRPPAEGDHLPAYRAYTSFRRMEVLRAIEQAVRARGFSGDLATICEVVNAESGTVQVVDLPAYTAAGLDFAVVTYDYDRSRRRRQVADLCLEQPRELGLRTFYLGRGVMTWNRAWRSPQPPLPFALPRNWAIDVEDVARYQPEGFWWFGTGALGPGGHVDLAELQRLGFADGRQARRQLIDAGSCLASRP